MALFDAHTRPCMQNINILLKQNSLAWIRITSGAGMRISMAPEKAAKLTWINGALHFRLPDRTIIGALIQVKIYMASVLGE